MVCGAPITPPAKCLGCGHDVLPWQKVCPYCGKPSGSASVDAAPAPIPVPPAPPPPRREPRDTGSRTQRITRILFRTLALSLLVGFVLTFRSAKGFWAVLAIVVWFILASRPLTRGRRSIRRTGVLHGDYEVSTSSMVVNLALSVGGVALSAVVWVVVFFIAFRGDFGASRTAFLLGLFLFAGSLLTNYKYKSTRTAVIDPDLEQHIDEFGYGIALVRQYYIWGLAAPFIHASFRLFF